jgi:hypothetical protein
MKNLKCKVLALCMGASVFMCEKAFSQVPSYVPTNGLVGWWPFNGNANDESGNGNNGTVNGATLTTDRNGNSSKAYSFDGINDFISMSNAPFTNPPFTISGWINCNDFEYNPIIGLGELGATTSKRLFFQPDNNAGIGKPSIGTEGMNDIASIENVTTIGNWHHLVVVVNSYNVNSVLFYFDGVLLAGNTTGGSNNPFPLNNAGFTVGKHTGASYAAYSNGKIDDIGLWSRALTQQEITTLNYICNGNEITTQPANSLNTVGSNAQFSLNAAVGSTFQWQSNPLSLGWQNVNNNSTYSGVTSNTLTISNTTISNHIQPFRAIVNAGGCIDTSDVAQIIIGDTCLTTVTDTLIINTTLGLPAPNNENTILIYPNPASDHITIDNGNFAAMAGYTIKIENNAGQQVFQSLINQAQFYVDLSTWSGNGLYFVHLIDAQGNTVTVRKIVLQ